MKRQSTDDGDEVVSLLNPVDKHQVTHFRGPGAPTLYPHCLSSAQSQSAATAPRSRVDSAEIARLASQAAAARSPGADRRQEQRAEATEDSDRCILPPRTALRLSSMSIASANTQSALGETPMANPEYPTEASGL